MPLWITTIYVWHFLPELILQIFSILIASAFRGLNKGRGSKAGGHSGRNVVRRLEDTSAETSSI